MPHRPLSMLAHVELLTPNLDASVAFARDMLGLFIVEEEGSSVYLRCWGDHYAYSLVLTEAPQPGLGHGAWRTWNHEQLDIAVASVEASGIRGEWIESSYGHGQAYRFVGPGVTRPSCSGTSIGPPRLPVRSRGTSTGRSVRARAESASGFSTT